ncbi:peptide methionine sulfoxide reductase MsrA [Gluconacetobacter liquefaciens]|uniref:Peptide methionine sulfoxide reductase MsrA n=1 Tax=Gluconacetobacter liquefaciens TaxID=89584 RepID=A0A370G1K7_GLULI|nr:peptide-methionine (S)-S-oxide reductase MsrA [Gluconacetobacter liquefaciens]MBB2187609.1 peptide-methionine (S)-S-oxide reductase MsrA [Gluconacetobacter liquefaciens]RDI36504.1 peptide-methionine (S)-S-oxide reductase [Gluconacetobacter liquefaciens]GBQ94553.1 methionine sulfoxide reductase A [Gluconacetobacter liquefaciens NRIC 0522]GEB37455.1 peptide methionine sulfoxide reductase MsrA [Gluconacetobacter liquefaciens]
MTNATKGHDPSWQTAYLAGGCFWCTEAALRELAGIEDVVPGYAGGDVASPTYEQVCTGRSGHAELVRVTFDPGVLSYADLLRIFFTIHDPTTLNRQGEDVGTQYRSAIFYATPEQERVAHEVRDEIAAARLWPDPIVTEIQPLTAFYEAEAYHHDYFAKHPERGYCAAVIAPKVAKVRRLFFNRLALARS